MLCGPDSLGVQKGADAPEVRLTGDLDLASAESMLAPAYELVGRGHRRIVLNCANLDFCDSQGLREMVGLLDAVQPGGSVTLADPSATLVRMLTIVGFVDRFSISYSDSAVAH